MLLVLNARFPFHCVGLHIDVSYFCTSALPFRSCGWYQSMSNILTYNLTGTANFIISRERLPCVVLCFPPTAHFRVERLFRITSFSATFGRHTSTAGF